MIRRTSFLVTVAVFALNGCGGGSGLTDNTPIAPTPPPLTGKSFNVQRCFDQMFDGKKVSEQFVPDVLSLDLSRPPGFPNGRRLQDPVIDIELSVLFLDQTRHTPTTLANVPLNPSAMDQPLRTSFPYFAPPLGSPRLSDTNGSNFAFRTDPASSYTRVERGGLPAVSTALVLGPRKNAYNDSSPAIDATGAFVGDLGAGLTALTNVLVDDLQGLGLVPCATQG